jgi:hypothetical protein
MMKSARYLTDDRDFKHRLELVISIGGNGDYYVSVVDEGKEPTAGVRLCTSGGAIRACQGLVTGIAQAYMALKDMETQNDHE